MEELKQFHLTLHSINQGGIYAQMQIEMHQALLHLIQLQFLIGVFDPHLGRFNSVLVNITRVNRKPIRTKIRIDPLSLV